MPTMMRDAAISFPLLGDWSIDPSASFTLFGRTFYWYGVIIAVGVLLATLYILRRVKQFGLTEDDVTLVNMNDDSAYQAFVSGAAASGRTRSTTFSSG